jgi:hypothetical protein
MKSSLFFFAALMGLGLTACTPAAEPAQGAPADSAATSAPAPAPAGGPVFEGPSQLFKEIDVRFTVSPASGWQVGDVVTLTFAAEVMEEGWHLYSALDEGDMAYNPTQLVVFPDETKGFELVGKMTESAKPIERHDPTLGGLVREFKEKQVTFTQQVKLTAPQAVLASEFHIQYCRDGMCKFAKLPLEWTLQ